MKQKSTDYQLELFQHSDSRTLENQIKQLEMEITQAIRQGNLKRAAALAEEQRLLIESQIGPPLD